MVIMTKQAVLFLDRKTGAEFRAPNGFIGKCPDWVCKTRQFKEMVADGMIVASDTTKDKDLAAAEKKAGKGKGKGKKSESASEAPETETPENAPENAPESGEAEDKAED